MKRLIKALEYFKPFSSQIEVEYKNNILFLFGYTNLKVFIVYLRYETNLNDFKGFVSDIDKLINKLKSISNLKVLKLKQHPLIYFKEIEGVREVKTFTLKGLTEFKVINSFSTTIKELKGFKYPLNFLQSKDNTLLINGVDSDLNIHIDMYIKPKPIKWVSNKKQNIYKKV